MTSNYQKIVEKVEEMKPLDAVDYLLGVIEQTDSIKEPGVDECSEIGFEFTPTEARLVRALKRADGSPVSKDSLYTAMYFDRTSDDELPGPKIVDVIVCKIRKKLVGYKIKTRRGFGYALEQMA